MRTSRPEVNTAPETFAPVAVTRLPAAVVTLVNHAFDLSLACDGASLREASREASQAADSLKLGLSKTSAILIEPSAAADRYVQGLALLLLSDLARNLAQIASVVDKANQLRGESTEPPPAK
jgi:hypothetical protein